MEYFSQGMTNLPRNLQELILDLSINDIGIYAENMKNFSKILMKLPSKL